MSFMNDYICTTRKSAPTNNNSRDFVHNFRAGRVPHLQLFNNLLHMLHITGLKRRESLQNRTRFLDLPFSFHSCTEFISIPSHIIESMLILIWPFFFPPTWGLEFTHPHWCTSRSDTYLIESYLWLYAKLAWGLDIKSWANIACFV